DVAAVEQAADRVRHGGAVDDRAVDDAVGRQRLGAEARHFVTLAGLFQLDRLDGARANIQTHEGFGSTKHVVSCFPETPKKPWQSALSAGSAAQVRCHGPVAPKSGSSAQNCVLYGSEYPGVPTIPSRQQQFCNLDNASNYRYPLRLPSFDRR